MEFSKNNREYLQEMGIRPESYEQSLVSEFGNEADLFEKLIKCFSRFSSEEMTTASFNNFYINCGHQSYGLIHEKLYDIFNYLRLFKESGKLGLYKGRQAEWEGPNIILERSDVPNSDIDLLPEPLVIYRGMSIIEFESGNFGQSWTTDADVAKRFALETYLEKPAGVVAKTLLKKSNVVYYDKDDSEREVIVKSGSVGYADKFYD